MAVNSVLAPYPSFFDAAGDPLENGFIYIGAAGFEARSTPKASFFDVAQAIPTGTASGAAIRTKAGFPVNTSNAPAMFYVDGDFSISVCDRNGVLLYSALNMTLALNVGAAVGPVLWADGNLGAVGGGFANETNTGFVRPSAGIMQSVVGGVLVSQQSAAGTVFAQPVSGAGFVSGVTAIAQPLDADLTAVAGLSGTGIAVRTAGNTWAQRSVTSSDGSISITNPAGVAGDIDIITSVSPVKCWGNFTAGSGAAGTYSRTGTLVTVTQAGHSLTTGMGVYLDFTTGTATDGFYFVTVIDPNTYTVVDSASGSTSGNLSRTVILRAGFNVASIQRVSTGIYNVTMNNAVADANYAIVVGGNAGNGAAASDINNWYSAFPSSTTLFSLQCYDAGSAVQDPATFSFCVLR